MRVAVIGAGAAGLAAARHVQDLGVECDVLEMSSQLGGTWVYTDDVGSDKYGFPVFSAMYQGLRTNLPKEVMGYPDFPIPEQAQSYLTQAEILHFLNLYANHFKIRRLIQFNRIVADISPLDSSKWRIKSIDKPSKKTIDKVYDAILVCNGHYNDPIIPKIPDQEKFQGKITHSHDYRSFEPFKNQKVLVIGAGPSGLDITLQTSRVAKYVVLSHHCKEARATDYPANVYKKPDVSRIKDSNLVEFVDGSCWEFDAIILCTGYRYKFPFLNHSCGITVEDNHIQPLYKHMIHITRPSMCFIGIPFSVCAFQMFDLQARFFCQYLKGAMALPSTKAMLSETDEDLKTRWAKGYSRRQAHMMGPDQQSYYEDLARSAKIASIAPVIVKLRDESVRRLYDDLLNFRNDRYRIVNREDFVKVY